MGVLLAEQSLAMLSVKEQDKEPAGLDWAPPRPKKKWIRHFFANEETPPSHEEFPPSLEPLPLYTGRLGAPTAPAPAPAPVPAAPQFIPAVPSAPPGPPPNPLPLPPAAPLAPNHPPVHQSSPQPGTPAPAAAPTLYLHSPPAPDSPSATSAASQDDDLLGQDPRRRAGSGTREVHNKLEKNRRAHLKECFEILKRQLPTCQEEKKCSNLSILHSAIRFIQSLRRKEREHEHEMERLAREKISAQQRLACLKKDLAAQWDHIDINALYPDCVDGAEPRDARLRLPSPASTSTASAEMEGGMIIDEDDDDVDDDDTMSFHSGRQRSASDSSSALPGLLGYTAAPQAPPNLRDVHGYRGESPQLPPQSPVSPRPRTASPVMAMRASTQPGPPGRTNGHAVDSNMYKNAVDRGASAPSSGYVPAKLLNYSIKVASPASTPQTSLASSSPPVGLVARVPSSPVGTLTTLPTQDSGRSRGSPPPGALAALAALGVPSSSPPGSSGPPGPTGPPGHLLQPVALPLTPCHIQMPMSAQVVSNGRWLGVSPTILQLATPANQRLILEPASAASLAQHSASSNGAIPWVTHQRIRELGGTASVGSPADKATAAITMPSVHNNKVMVGATGIVPGVTIVADSFHKSSSPDGIRPIPDVGLLCRGKGLQISNDTNGHLLTASVHPGSASMPAHVTPLVTPVTVQGSPVTHILTTSPVGKMSPLIKTMPIVNSQYLGSAVVKPTMVVVSTASNHPPNSGV